MKIIKYKNFEVRPLAGALGAEILDINLNKIDDETFNEIYKALINAIGDGRIFLHRE